MIDKVSCLHCHRELNYDYHFVEKAHPEAKDKTLIMLECPFCHQGTVIDLKNRKLVKLSDVAQLYDPKEVILFWDRTFTEQFERE